MAICPLRRNAVMRVKRPTAMRIPPTNSSGPAVQISAFGTPGGMPPKTLKIFCAPWQANMIPARMRKTPRILGACA